MSNHINYTRVRRIKNAVYAFIVLLFLVPAILLIILGVQMIQYLGPMRSIIAQGEAPQAAGPSGAGESAPAQQGNGLHLQFPASEQPADLLEPEEVFPWEPEPTAEPPFQGEDAPLGQPEADPPAQSGADASQQPFYGDLAIPNTGLPREGE